jgi:DNA-binding NarL/FixJ family response regulator
MAARKPSADSLFMTTHKATTIYLVDDSVAIRERLRELLGESATVRVLGEADCVAAAIEGIRSLQPDYVILDYKLPDGTGIDVLRATAQAAPKTVFVVLTNYFTEQMRTACKSAGAHHFLDKSGNFDPLNAIIVEHA